MKDTLRRFYLRFSTGNRTTAIVSFATCGNWHLSCFEVVKGRFTLCFIEWNNKDSLHHSGRPSMEGDNASTITFVETEHVSLPPVIAPATLPNDQCVSVLLD